MVAGVLGLVLAGPLARANDALPPVVVTATRVPEPLVDVPAAMSVVDRPDIQDARPTVSIAESLPRVPGVFAQESGNFAQDVRLQIRGFGTRAAFGIRELKVLMDGLPLTLPDGQTELDDVDFGVVDRIEVVRGPSAALYGNASGGVVQLFTMEAPATPTVAVRLTGGSSGLGKVQVRGGARSGPARLALSGSFLRQEGFRTHSATESGTVTGSLRYDLGAATDVTVLVAGVDAPTAEDPGAVTRATASRDPRAARDLNIRLDAGEAVQQGRLGVVLRHRTARSELSTYAYGLYRDFENRLPITPAAGDGIVTFHRRSPGGGGRYTLEVPVLGWTNRLLVGLDVQNQDDDRRRYANQDGARGALGLHQTEGVTSVGPYVRDTLVLGDDLELNAGVRYDQVRFAVDVDVPPGSADGGTRTFTAWSPGGGVRWTPRPGMSLFADAGTAFQVPTTTELGRPDGPGFDPALVPQTAVGGEAGARLFRGERLQASAAGFVTNLDDLLIPFESPSGRTAFRNAGSARRYGAELDWQAWALPRLRWSGALTFIDARFRDYRTATGTFDGRHEPGIPGWQVYQELFYRHPGGAFVALEAFVVDGYPVNDANTARSDMRYVLDLRGGWAGTVGRWTIAPFVGLRNLTAQRYDGTVRLNARGGRYFEPAPGFSVFGGLTVEERLK